MTDFVGLLSKVLALIDLPVEYKRLQQDGNLFQSCVKIFSEDISVVGVGKSYTEAKQRAARELLAKILTLYHDELLLSLHLDKLSVLRNTTLERNQ